MIGMGFVKKWQQLAALRVVLGVFEVRTKIYYSTAP
jgi:hypothetical protein